MTPQSSGEPAISVVVPSHDRPVRLLWLLNALAEQTLDQNRFEVIVCHDSRGPETEELLRRHRLAENGTLRQIKLEPGPGPAFKRNLAWKQARSPLVVFTDDDCRPPVDWLERALLAARREPGAIVQGATQPDPDEAYVLKAAPYARTQWIEPPTVWAQTCNIIYPRHVLEASGGFDTEMTDAAGEDTDLALRAIDSGVAFVGAPDVVTYHAVLDESLRDRLRSAWRWDDLPLAVKRHPQLRRELPLWIFWKRRHVWLPLALLGILLQRRSRFAVLLTVPWAIHASPDHTSSPRGRVRSLLELPGRALIDGIEMAAMVRGSVRHRSLLL